MDIAALPMGCRELGWYKHTEALLSNASIEALEVMNIILLSLAQYNIFLMCAASYSYSQVSRDVCHQWFVPQVIPFGNHAVLHVPKIIMAFQ